jgi:hypothetical protein
VYYYSSKTYKNIYVVSYMKVLRPVQPGNNASIPKKMDLMGAEGLVCLN